MCPEKAREWIIYKNLNVLMPIQSFPQSIHEGLVQSTFQFLTIMFDQTMAKKFAV